MIRALVDPTVKTRLMFKKSFSGFMGKKKKKISLQLWYGFRSIFQYLRLRYKLYLTLFPAEVTHLLGGLLICTYTFLLGIKNSSLSYLLICLHIYITTVKLTRVDNYVHALYVNDKPPQLKHIPMLICLTLHII